MGRRLPVSLQVGRPPQGDHGSRQPPTGSLERGIPCRKMSVAVGRPVLPSPGAIRGGTESGTVALSRRLVTRMTRIVERRRLNDAGLEGPYAIRTSLQLRFFVASGITGVCTVCAGSARMSTSLCPYRRGGSCQRQAGGGRRGRAAGRSRGSSGRPPNRLGWFPVCRLDRFHAHASSLVRPRSNRDDWRLSGRLIAPPERQSRRSGGRPRRPGRNRRRGRRARRRRGRATS